MRTNLSEVAARLAIAALLCAAALAAALAAGCVGSSMTQAPPPPPPQPASATIQVCNNTPAGCAASAAFSLTDLRDLAINVTWSNVPAGTHTQTLAILEPGGGLFEAKTQAFAIPDGSNGSVDTAETMPVAGTWITQRARTGAWTVQISLDSEIVATKTVQFDP
jgi:hypothetical protein